MHVLRPENRWHFSIRFHNLGHEQELTGEKLGFVYFNDVGFLNSGSDCSFAPGGRVSGGGFTRIAGADPDESRPGPPDPAPASCEIPELVAELGMKLGGGGPVCGTPGGAPTMLDEAGGKPPGL